MPTSPRVTNVVRLPAAVLNTLHAQCVTTRRSFSDVLRTCIRAALQAQPILVARAPRTRAQAQAENARPVSFRMDKTLLEAVQACTYASNPHKPVSQSEALRQLIELGMGDPEAVTPTAAHSCTHTFLAALPSTVQTELRAAAADQGKTLDAYVVSILTAYAEELYALRLGALSREQSATAPNLFD
jgi:hypothetical protein